MAGNSTHPAEPTELVYVAAPTWTPFFAAAGLTGLVVGLFAGIVYAIIGAVVLLVALARWIRSVGDEVARLPRTQRQTAAVLPPIPPARKGR